jgi:hypothetical protein
LQTVEQEDDDLGRHDPSDESNPTLGDSTSHIFDMGVWQGKKMEAGTLMKKM